MRWLMVAADAWQIFVAPLVLTGFSIRETAQYSVEYDSEFTFKFFRDSVREQYSQMNKKIA